VNVFVRNALEPLYFVFSWHRRLRGLAFRTSSCINAGQNDVLFFPD